MTTTQIRGFDHTTTAADVLVGVDLSGRTAIVTGASSGIGAATAAALAGAGAHVTLAVRDTRAGEGVAGRLAQRGGHVDVRSLHLDDLDSIDRFAAEWSGKLDILINNAAVMALPESYTDAGWETHFAVNHLGHFALTRGLLPSLRQGDRARIVAVSSSGHDESPVVFDDLFFRRRPYDPMSAYGQSKTANSLFAVEASTRWRGDGITANACMPGGVWTKLQQHWDPDVLARIKHDAGDAVKTPEQGAATSVLLATAPELDGVGGRYFEDCHEAEIVPKVTDGVHGVREWALNSNEAQRLWDVSTALVDAEEVRRRPAPERLG